MEHPRPNKLRFPIGNPRKSGDECDLGVLGVWGVIFTANVMKRIAGKLRRIILLHSGLITFRIHFRRTRKPFMFMVSDLADVTMTPKTNYS